MAKRAGLASVILLAALAVAVIGATAALRLIGKGTFGPGGSTLTEADVRQSLSQLAPSASSASPSPTARPTRRTTSPPHRSSSPGRGPAPATGAFTSSGGTVFASCTGSIVTLKSWIPNGGYGTDGSSPGPAASAWVKFKSGSTELTVMATCVNGQPKFGTSSDERGGGGGGHGGGGHGGGSGR